MNYKYGHFSDNGCEFIITNPETPRAFDNFLWNDSIFSNVQQTGVGYIDYQIGDNEAVQLFTGIGRICDFDVFGRDHLMNRLIYVRDNDTGEFWNINWEPVKKAYTAYKCTHGLGYSRIENETSVIGSEFQIFIPDGEDPVELWSIKLKNLSEKNRSLSVFVYNQFQFKFKWGFDSYGDMIYRTTWLDVDENALFATKHPFRRPHNYLTAFMTSNTHIDAFDGSRDAFVGQYNTLASPQAVVNGKCSNTPGSAEATVGALQFDFELEPNNESSIEIIIGIVSKVEELKKYKDKYFNSFEFYLKQLETKKLATLDKYSVHTPDEHYNRIINIWVKQATMYGAQWCRWGWMGYRDIVQHGYGVSTLIPSRTRDILIKALAHQSSNGLAVRGWYPIDEKPYSDSPIWLVFTLVSYIKETGDTSFLEQIVPFYDEGDATVKAHIEIAMDFLEISKGTHKLLLIKYGDWNDSLTGAGKEGKGESIWLSQAYAEAMSQLAELSEFLGDFEKKAEYQKRKESIVSALNANGWDGEWYTRCYDDNGKPIGSNTNEFAKIFMEPQCWALISGIADEKRAETLIKSCDKMLDTKVGYLLLSPTFTEIDDNIGRISSMEPGIAENGTVYSHLNIWMILGLLKYGMADKAYEIFKKISPGYVSSEDDAKQNCLPYMYSNCYFGPDHKNNAFQMEFSWITGSVAWFNNVLVQYMLGVRAEYNGLMIDPCLPSHWEECSVKREFMNATYEIKIVNPQRIQKGKVEIVVDGNSIKGNILPIFKDNAIHKVEATIKKFTD